jgi:hypothetical protein
MKQDDETTQIRGALAALIASVARIEVGQVHLLDRHTELKNQLSLLATKEEVYRLEARVLETEKVIKRVSWASVALVCGVVLNSVGLRLPFKL